MQYYIFFRFTLVERCLRTMFCYIQLFLFSFHLCPENLVAKTGQFVSLFGFRGDVGFWERMGEGGLGGEGRGVL